jgi:spoIIIJ-associated protein
MRKIIATGKTVEEATKNALQQLKASLDQVQVTVLKQPSRGFLGIIGTRNAEVEVVVKEQSNEFDASSKTDTKRSEVIQTVSDELKDRKFTLKEKDEHGTEDIKIDQDQQQHGSTLKSVAESIQEAYRFLTQVVDAMGLQDVKIESSKKDDRYEFRLYGKNIGILIGKHGHTLDSLQYLVNLVANKHSERYIRIQLDAEGYRMRRQEALENLADRLAEKALRERKEIVLEPMTSAERKVIHMRLQNRNDVKTQSRGEDPYRKIVIIPKVFGVK